MKKEYWLITIWAIIMIILLILFAIIANRDPGKDASLDVPQNMELPPPGIPELPLAPEQEGETSAAATINEKRVPTDEEIERYFNELNKSNEPNQQGQPKEKITPPKVSEPSPKLVPIAPQEAKGPSTPSTIEQMKTEPAVTEIGGGWVLFKSISEGFEIEFPEKPKDSYGKIYQSSVDTEVEYHDFLAIDPKDETIYMVIVRNYPSAALKSGTNMHLESVLKEIMSTSPQNKLISSRLTNYRLFPAIEFHMEFNGLHSRGVIAMVNGRMVQLSTTYKTGVNADRGYERFLKSFKVIGS
jgi:hypothetical protein